MPTKRSRSVAETDAGWRYLLEAADLAPGQGRFYDFATSSDARKVAGTIRRLRDSAAPFAPGTLEPSAVDPRGEGRGHYDFLRIELKGTRVTLRHPKRFLPEPVGTGIVEC